MNTAILSALVSEHSAERARQHAEWKAEHGIVHSVWFWITLPIWGPFWIIWWVIRISFLVTLWPITLPLYLARHRRAKEYKQSQQAAEEAKNHREVTVTISKEDVDKLKSALK